MVGIVQGKTMLKHWRISVFLIAVVAAMGAPGSDVMTMFYLGAPLALLFEIVLSICLLNDRHRDKKLAQEGNIGKDEFQSWAQHLFVSTYYGVSVSTLLCFTYND